MGLLIGDHTHRISVHHNLMAHNNYRNPQPKGDTTSEIVNNVVFNWGYSAIPFSDPENSGSSKAHIIANYFVPGPNSKPGVGCIDIGSDMKDGTQVYLHGNKVEGDWPLVTPRPSNDRYLCSKPVLQGSSLPAEPAAKAYQHVLAGAGAIHPRRDPVDRRIVEHVKNRNGTIVDSQEEVGGWPKYRSGKAERDNDADGMPDEWEKRHGLAPNRSDNNGDNDKDGYTNIEEFLNGTDPKRKDHD